MEYNPDFCMQDLEHWWFSTVQKAYRSLLELTGKIT